MLGGQEIKSIAGVQEPDRGMSDGGGDYARRISTSLYVKAKKEPTFARGLSRSHGSGACRRKYAPMTHACGVTFVGILPSAVCRRYGLDGRPRGRSREPSRHRSSRSGVGGLDRLLSLPLVLLLLVSLYALALHLLPFAVIVARDLLLPSTDDPPYSRWLALDFDGLCLLWIDIP